jgi:hypothetical protein
MCIHEERHMHERRKGRSGKNMKEQDGKMTKRRKREIEREREGCYRRTALVAYDASMRDRTFQ